MKSGPIKHGHARPGKRSPEWNCYTNAKQRCTNPKDPRFYCYGARGIKFKFASFKEFFSALGSRPSGAILDRIDNDGHYEAGNVRWVDRSESAKNSRFTERKRAALAQARTKINPEDLRKMTPAKWGALKKAWAARGIAV